MRQWGPVFYRPGSVLRLPLFPHGIVTACANRHAAATLVLLINDADGHRQEADWAIIHGGLLEQDLVMQLATVPDHLAGPAFF